MIIEQMFISLSGGVLASLLWLWFWLKEDKKNPEPRRLIALCFLAGMCAVPLVIPFEQMVLKSFGTSVMTLFLWAAIEEIGKFLVVYIAVFHNREFDEPIDAVVYMIAGALGFAALENAFFIFQPLYEYGALESLITGNLRFIGATLLHSVASALIGITIALSFYEKRTTRETYGILGCFFATILHAFFNLSIMRGNGDDTIIAFYSVWMMAVVLLLFFERVKSITNITLR